MSDSADDTTEVIIQRWQRGIDRERNFRRLVEKYYQRVYRFFLGRGLPPEDSRDLTQNAFVRVYKGLEGYRGKGFKTWLFLGISRNLYLNELRRRSASKRAGEEIPLPTTDAELDALEPGSKPVSDAQTDSQLEETLRRERLAYLREAIMRLPRQQCRCVQLRGFQGLSHEEIARILQLEVGTVKAHLAQARKRLRTELGHLFTDFDL